jgi:protein TonB
MNRLTTISLLLNASLSTCTQQEAPAPPVVTKQKPAAEKVYTYVEQMPELPSGGGTQAIINEIQKRTRYPIIDTSKQMRYSGIKYTFVVDTTGKVRGAAMVASSDNAAVDQAILDAVRSLPKFSPGRQAGRLVPVRFTIPISCILVR